MSILLKLLRGKELSKKCLKLHLSHAAGCLYIGQCPLKAAYIAGQGLHLAKPLLHRLKLLGDKLKGAGEPFLQSIMQLLINCNAHLLQLLLVALLNVFETCLHRLLLESQVLLGSLGK